MGSHIWINRFRVFCLRQKTKSYYSTTQRHRVNGSPLFYFKHVYPDSFRYNFGRVTIYYYNIRSLSYEQSGGDFNKEKEK